MDLFFFSPDRFSEDVVSKENEVSFFVNIAARKSLFKIRAIVARIPVDLRLEEKNFPVDRKQNYMVPKIGT